MLKHEQNGAPINQMDEPWHQAGRNPLLQQDGITEIAMDLQKKAGFSLDDKEVEVAIQKATDKDN